MGSQCAVDVERAGADIDAAFLEQKAIVVAAVAGERDGTIGVDQAVDAQAPGIGVRIFGHRGCVTMQGEGCACSGLKRGVGGLQGSLPGGGHTGGQAFDHAVAT